MAAAISGIVSAETGDTRMLFGPATGCTAIADTSNGQNAYVFRDATATGNSTYFAQLSLTEVYMSMHVLFEVGTTPGSLIEHRMCLLLDGSSNVIGVIEVNHYNDGTWWLETYDSNGSWTGFSYKIPTLTANTWYRLEIYVKSDAAAGIITCKWEGVQVINATGKNTRGTPIVSLNGLSNSAGASSPWRMSECCFSTAGYPETPYVLARQGKAGTPTDTGFTTLNGGATSVADAWSETPFSATKSAATPSTTAAVSQTMLVASFGSTQAGHGSGVIAPADFITGIMVGAVAKTSSTSSGGSSGNLRYRIGGVATNVAKTIGTSDVFYTTMVTAPSYANLNSMEAGWSKSTTTANRVHTVEDAWVFAAYVHNPAATIAGGAGAFALSGAAATGRHGYAAAANSNSYALAGVAATLKHAWKVAAAAGAFAYSGSAAALLKAWRPSAAAGSYGLTGTAATMRLGHALAAATGSFALLGANAPTLLSHKLAGAAGSFALVGADVALTKRVPHALAAGVGSFALNGQSAGAAHGWRAAASSASYSLNGTAAAVLHAARLAAQVGAFTVSGSAAQTLLARKTTAGAGSFGMAGQDAIVRKGSVAIINSGAFNLSGQSAAVVASGHLAAAAGVFALAGQQANLNYSGSETEPAAGGWYITARRRHGR